MCYINLLLTLALTQWCSAHKRSYSTLGPVSTWMGDHLRAAIPLRYVTTQHGWLVTYSALHPSANQVPTADTSI